MTFVRVLLLSALLAACASDPPPPPLPPLPPESAAPVEVTDEAVAAIEARVMMPTAAAPLAEYDRYYSGARLGGREGIMGVLLRRSVYGAARRTGMAPIEGRDNSYRGPLDAMPSVTGGGCNVVTLYYDVNEQNFFDIHRENLSIERAPAVCNAA